MVGQLMCMIVCAYLPSLVLVPSATTLQCMQGGVITAYISITLLFDGSISFHMKKFEDILYY